MRIEDMKKEPEMAEMIEGSEGDRRRLSELHDFSFFVVYIVIENESRGSV